MKRLLIATLLATPALAHAQWQVGGSLGFRTRPEDGRTLPGTQLEIMAVKPAGVTSHVFSLASVQMRNRTAAGGAVRENSFEAAYLYRRVLDDAFGGVFKNALKGAFKNALGLAAGPVVSYSIGCASGGTGAVTYGATPCLVSFADKGTVTPGYIIQLDLQKTNQRGVTWRAGLRGTGHTVASGSLTPKPSLWAGFTAPLG